MAKKVKKVLYRTVIQIEVLSEEPIDENMSLNDIEDECNSGSFSGAHNWIVTNEKIEGEKAVELTLAQGSSIDFFQMDVDGNEIEDDNDDDDKPSSMIFGKGWQY